MNFCLLCSNSALGQLQRNWYSDKWPHRHHYTHSRRELFVIVPYQAQVEI